MPKIIYVGELRLADDQTVREGEQILPAEFLERLVIEGVIAEPAAASSTAAVVPPPLPPTAQEALPPTAQAVPLAIPPAPRPAAYKNPFNRPSKKRKRISYYVRPRRSNPSGCTWFAAVLM